MLVGIADSPMSIQWPELLRQTGPNAAGVFSAALGFGTMRVGAIIESYILVLVAFGLLFNGIYWLFLRERERPTRWPTRS